jgi:hypothetical protein
MAEAQQHENVLVRVINDVVNVLVRVRNDVVNIMYDCQMMFILGTIE